MGYDVQFVQVPASPEATFPIDERTASGLLEQKHAFGDSAQLRKKLLGMEGTKPAPKDGIDFLGRGLSYARFFIRDDAIHVENNCSARDLLNIYHAILADHPSLLILDLQSRKLYDADSFLAWWNRPL